MSDVLGAEWLKLWTARSTRIVLGTLALLTILMLGLAWYFVASWDGLSPDARAHAALGSLPDLMGWIAALVMAVFGTVAVTSEFSSGMIATTFLAMPRRSTVLAAKAFVVAAVTFLATEAALLATLLGSAAIIGDRAIGGQPSVDLAGARLLVAMGLSTVTFALIGLGLGAVTRSGLASVVALALLWYIVPLIVAHVPSPWNDWLSSLVPGALAGQIAGTGNANSVFGAALSPVAALVVMAAYAIAPVAAGWFVLTRTDA